MSSASNGERVPMLIGGMADATLRRIVRWGIGWTVGGASADMIPPFAERVRVAWKEGGRQGEPRIVALLYFALGPDAEEGARKSLGDYYAYLGAYADKIVAGAAKTPEAAMTAAKTFEEAGVDELIYFPGIAQVDQVDLLAEAVTPG